MAKRTNKKLFKTKTMKNYHTFWDNFNVELYKSIVDSRKPKDDDDDKKHQKIFII